MGYDDKVWQAKRFIERHDSLTTETIQGAALALECVDDIKRGHGLALGVLGVGDGITDDALKEGLEDTTGLFVDHCKRGQQCSSKEG